MAKQWKKSKQDRIKKQQKLCQGWDNCSSINMFKIQSKAKDAKILELEELIKHLRSSISELQCDIDGAERNWAATLDYIKKTDDKANLNLYPEQLCYYLKLPLDYDNNPIHIGDEVQHVCDSYLKGIVTSVTDKEISIDSSMQLFNSKYFSICNSDSMRS